MRGRKVEAVEKWRVDDWRGWRVEEVEGWTCGWGGVEWVNGLEGSEGEARGGGGVEG